MQAYMTQDLQWMTTRPITDVLRYQAVSYPDFRHGPQESIRQLRVYTELPPGFNPRTLALAAEMRADPALAGASTQVLVNAVLQRLRTGATAIRWSPASSVSIPPTSSGSTARKASASTFPRPS